MPTVQKVTIVDKASKIFNFIAFYVCR